MLTFAVQVVPGSNHVGIIRVNSQDSQGGVTQCCAKDGGLIFNVSAEKQNTVSYIVYITDLI